MAERPVVRWGIISAGMISSWFVEDLVLDRPEAPVQHRVVALGCRSEAQGETFVRTHCPQEQVKVYGSYAEVYADAAVDIVYIGTPHGLHRQNCLDAIAAGKNVLCEKAFTLNVRETKEVIAAASQKGVYLAEAMWLRHRPVVQELRRLIHDEKIIGDVFRAWSDFGLNLGIADLPPDHKAKDLNLGAGSLLDIGIYPLTWMILALDPGSPSNSERPTIHAVQSHLDNVEVTTSMIVHYPNSGRQGVATASTLASHDPAMVARIQGTTGFIEVDGPCPSDPEAFIVYPQSKDRNGGRPEKQPGRRYDFPVIGKNYVHIADNTALDILHGRKESEIMPLAETVRVMEYMDDIRRQGGSRFPADEL
ncbi:Oxidoreductase-like protein 10 [Elsinoe fawcettii]|nr:Oxidoreductase-like protein 10 [Elsinoe fawcettii]